MKVMTRRKFVKLFMGGLVGSTVAPLAFGKSKTACGESVDKKVSDILFATVKRGKTTFAEFSHKHCASNASDAANVVWPDVKSLESPKEIRQHEPSNQGDFTNYATKRLEEMNKYNVIDDLVEEMNRNDAKYPDYQLRYFIHCNYSGLGMLNQTGQLEKGIYEPDSMRGYRHVLWIPINFPGVSRGIRVSVSMIQKADIEIVSCREEKCHGKEFHPRHYCLVTSRCFNVDYAESGKVLMKEC